MVISQMIEQLQEIQQIAGDCPIYVWRDGVDYDIHALMLDEVIRGVSIAATTHPIAGLRSPNEN